MGCNFSWNFFVYKLSAKTYINSTFYNITTYAQFLLDDLNISRIIDADDNYDAGFFQNKFCHENLIFCLWFFFFERSEPIDSISGIYVPRFWKCEEPPRVTCRTPLQVAVSPTYAATSSWSCKHRRIMMIWIRNVGHR